MNLTSKTRVKTFPMAGWGDEVFQIHCLRFISIVLAFLDGSSKFVQLISQSPLTHVFALYLNIHVNIFPLTYTSFVQTVCVWDTYPTSLLNRIIHDGELLGWTDPRKHQTLCCTALWPYLRLLEYLAVVYPTTGAPAMLLQLFGSPLSTTIIIVEHVTRVVTEYNVVLEI